MRSRPALQPPVFIDAIAWWSEEWADWEQAAQALRSSSAADEEAVGGRIDNRMAAAADASLQPVRPSPKLLHANERRRAPDAVLLALQVASSAAAASTLDAARLLSVFSSAHGDLPTTDAMCRSLAADPTLLSPTRFHHSVHNAASGYWSMASGSHGASTALAARQHSFALGWIEAAALCAVEQAPVLLVAFDTEAVGPLASVNSNQGLLAVALVLSPRRGPSSAWSVAWGLDDSTADLHTTPLPSCVSQARWRHNPTAAALPLFMALAAAKACRLKLTTTGARPLILQLSPCEPGQPG